MNETLQGVKENSLAIIEQIKAFDYMGYTLEFFSKLTFEDFVKIIATYLLLLWAGIVVWVTKDIINRTNNIFFQMFAILTVLIGTPLGLFIYFIIRPSKTLFEKHYEENDFDEEEIYAEGLLKELERIINQNSFNSRCRSCKFPVRKDYKYCPNCRIELIKSCISCKNAINDKWDYCPHCGQDQQEKVSKIISAPDLSKVFKEDKSDKVEKKEDSKKENNSEVKDDKKKEESNNKKTK